MIERLKKLINETIINDRCDYDSNAVILKIIKLFNETESTNQEYWLQTLIAVIGRIKDDKHGTIDPAVKDGKKVWLPYGRKKCMAVFYKNMPERRYLIYDFKIIDR